jgi:hypothetical protein
MNKVITIPKKISQEGLVLISLNEYERLLESCGQKKGEEKDTDDALKIYKKEKGERNLKTIKSLADLD